MSEYEALREMILAAMDAVTDNGRAVNRYADAVNEQVAALWADNAELRDELHALANRHESLLKLVAKHITLTAPKGIAEVAELRREVFGDGAA